MAIQEHQVIIGIVTQEGKVSAREPYRENRMEVESRAELNVAAMKLPFQIPFLRNVRMRG